MGVGSISMLTFAKGNRKSWMKSSFHRFPKSWKHSGDCSAVRELSIFQSMRKDSRPGSKSKRVGIRWKGRAPGRSNTRSVAENNTIAWKIDIDDGERPFLVENNISGRVLVAELQRKSVV